MLVARKLSEIVNVDLDDVCKFRTTYYSKIKDLSKKLRENCKYVNFHFGPSFRRLLIGFNPKSKI